MWQYLVLGFLLCAGQVVAVAQEEIAVPASSAAEASRTESPGDKSSTDPSTGEKTPVEQTQQVAEKIAAQAKQEAEKVARIVDESAQAKVVAAGVLQPIYVVAQKLAFPAFHWLAFALMVAGVVSYAGQLLIGKLVVLSELGFSLSEIISDAVGLTISIIGLVLTTQAAAQNSTFTQSPAAVLSSTAVGLIFGLMLYLWGQSQELQAAAGRSKRS